MSCEGVLNASHVWLLSGKVRYTLHEKSVFETVHLLAQARTLFLVSVRGVDKSRDQQTM
jgi:hypothetical protein